ncbi:MAG TPA: folylpolyglutamate synthase/dihydrofolate synthase family protein [Anaerolineales bacterium]|nr:folylpolyglutamate synthase/dihydrofolate synthase family protein [Anaerolineales bacterium]
MTDIETAYNSALDYLYSFVDYSLKHSSELAKADFNLDRMRALMAELGNPQAKFPVVHVAGTKGKGSVSALCASALQAAGCKVGLYTSPHLLDYCERIQIDGQPVPHQGLVDLVEQVKPAVAKIPRLTTFEITSALGFLYFAQQKVDAAVIEVGLGGRLDATNVVMPKVAVITSLSYDHMAVLGNTLALIAGEKAGIIKAGVPVVSAPQKDEPLEVLVRIAKERNAPFTLVGRDVIYESLSHSLDRQTLKIANLEFSIPLLGVHQVDNAATAYAALKASGLKISDAQIRKGFADVKWPARFEVVRREPPVIFDAAHNQDSFARLRQALDDYFPDKPVYLIFGASEDKNIPGMFTEMKPKIRKMFVTRADHPRALEPEKIQELARQAGIPNEAAAPVEAAFGRALELSAKDGSIVLSAGSMFVTAEVMMAWKKMRRNE